MNDQQRAELDAWFAQADDVLADWRPGTDAMHAPASREPSDDLPAPGESFYEQSRRIDAWQPPGEWQRMSANYFGSRVGVDPLTYIPPPPSVPRLDVQ